MSLRAVSMAFLVGLGAVALATTNINCNVETTGPAKDAGVADAGGGGGGQDAGGGGGTGPVDVTISCSTAGCGVSGTIIVAAKDCGAGAMVHATDNSQVGPLTDGSPVQVQILGVPTGSRCVQAYIDVNANTTMDTGDIVAGGGESTVEVMDQGTTANVVLDTVMP